jgi:nicotinamidase-related amidase
LVIMFFESSGMLTIDRNVSALLLIDLQIRMIPAINDVTMILKNTSSLIAGSTILEIPRLFTEHNPAGLGHTIEDLKPHGVPIIQKMTFDACRSPDIGKLPDKRSIIVAGCEAHVCVLQTVLGLLDLGRRVYVVEDAVGSRDPKSKTTALHRMASHGAEIVSTEMVLFEWVESAEHPRFREVLALVK